MAVQHINTNDETVVISNNDITSITNTASLLFTRKKGRSEGITLYYDYIATGDETDITLTFKSIDDELSEDGFEYKQIDASDNLVQYKMIIPKSVTKGKIPLSFARNEEKIIISVKFSDTVGSEGTIGIAIKEDYPDWHQLSS